MATPVIPKGRVILIGGALLILLVLGLVIVFGARDASKSQVIPLTVWGVNDSRAVFETIAAGAGPRYEITYQEFSPATYEAELINALASGRGPDVFMVHSSWIPKHFAKLVPAPNTALSLGSFQSLFPTVVEQDFAPDGFIYALPLFIDTLALIYNRDMFDAKGIALPPKTWADFQNMIPRLREQSANGTLVKAGASIGGSLKNIDAASDILSALMLQSGAPMVSPDFRFARFAKEGRGALLFYTQFANPASAYYTWNDSLPSSFDALGNGSAAAIITYGENRALIREKNPFLRMGIAALPQPSGTSQPLHYASYWGLGASNQSASPAGAWQFIVAALTNEQAVGAYASEGAHLPALRTLIGERTNDAEWGVFARQALAARSWPQADSAAVKTIFSTMIDNVINGRRTIDDALEEAENAVTALMQKRL